MYAIPLVLAQEAAGAAPPVAAPGVIAAVTVPITLALLGAAWAFTHAFNWKWSQVTWGILVGVAGSTSFIGVLAWAIIGFLVNVITNARV